MKKRMQKNLTALQKVYQAWQTAQKKKFINKNSMPSDRWKDVTYGKIIVNYRPEKEDPYRVRLRVGGDRLT